MTSQATKLRDKLVSNNQIGITLREKGKDPRSNFVIHTPITSRLFMHGRDFVKPNAAYDSNGKFIPDGGTTFPFTEHAMKMVDYYQSYESLPERKRRELTDDIISWEAMEKAIIDRLEEKLPGQGIRKLYEDLLNDRKKEREIIKRDPDAYAKQQVQGARKAMEIARNHSASPEVKAYAETVFKQAIQNKYKDAAKELSEKSKKSMLLIDADGNIDFDAYRETLKYYASSYVDKIPIHVLPEGAAKLSERIGAVKKMDMHRSNAYYSEAVDEALSRCYDNAVQSGALKTKTEKCLAAIDMPDTARTRLVKNIAQYEYDPQQVTHVITAIENGASPVSPIETLITEGKAINVRLQLEALAKNLYNPYAEEFMKKEREMADEFISHVPLPILTEACRDKIPFAITLGEPELSASAKENMSAGGYVYQNNIPIILMDIGRSGNVSLGEMVRHELRHYWNVKGNFSERPEMEAAAENDARRFFAMQEATAKGEVTPEITQLISALGKEATLETAKAVLNKVETGNDAQRNNAWLDAFRNTKEDKIGYTTKQLKLEELFPRVDATAMLLGVDTTKAIFPETMKLLERYDEEFMKKFSPSHQSQNSWTAKVAQQESCDNAIKRGA